MAISYVGSASGTTSATPPAHQAGDLFIAHVFRDGSNSTPTLPAGWTSIDTNTTNSAGGLTAYKLAASSAETCTGFTNGTNLLLHVYRGADQANPIGGHTPATAASTTVSYPALTMAVANGTSWVAGFASHRSVDTALETPPTGMTNRSNLVDATDESAGHDTNGGVSSWSLQTVSVGGTSSGWYGQTVEVRAAAAAVTTGNFFALF